MTGALFAVAICLSFITGIGTGVEVTSGVGNSTARSVTKFPEGMFGVWLPKLTVPIKAVLGPLAYEFLSFHEGGFSALRDPKTGDVWLTLLVGQVFHISGNNMQECFGEVGLNFEQIPFSLNSISENDITFCWRTGLRGLPTQPLGCSGCDCAKVHIILTDPNTLNFKFWFSPPAIHANATFTRSGPEPSMAKAIYTTMVFPYQQCTFRNHTGPNVPGEPDLGHRRRTTNLGLPGGCARATLSKAKENPDIALLLEEASASLNEVDANSGEKICHQLNGINHMFNSLAKRLRPSHVMDVPDVKLQFKKPRLPCNPCDVSYSVSAKIEEDEYIAVGFKGQSWEQRMPYPPKDVRPCYYGMCVDSYDNYTSDRIALGYASSSDGGCVREMVSKKRDGSKNYVGTPVDVDYKILSKTSVERHGDRTIVRFTVSQHWHEFNPTKGILPDGFARVMWAIGKVSGSGGCAADIGYHAHRRGVAPIDWFIIINSTPCRYSPFEMGDPDVGDSTVVI